jgi:general secretion pathway protein E
VHFEPTPDEMRVRFRVDGLLHEVDRLPQALAENVITRLKVLGGLLTYRVDIPQEGSFTLESPPAPSIGPPSPPMTAPRKGPHATDVRIATFPTIHGERAVARLLVADDLVTDLGALGLGENMSQRLRTLVHRPNGLILVTGPAGSGKSTTLYALARCILRATPGRSVISLEDPVEQRIAGLTQVQVQPHGELDYVRAMRSLLRQDVQVLLVGEIRDAAVAHVVVEAALTGHLILSTMHCGDPAECISRLLEMGIAPYQLVSTLSTVCAQRLVRCVCTECGGAACDECAATGYRGRTACACLAEIDAELHAAVLRHAPAAELRALIVGRFGNMLDDAQRLLSKGRTTPEEIARVVGDMPPNTATAQPVKAPLKPDSGERRALV